MKKSNPVGPVSGPKTPQTPLPSTYQTFRPHVLRSRLPLASAIRDRRSHRRARLATPERYVSNRHHSGASPY